MQPCAPRQSEQKRFRLVGQGMGGGDFGLLPLGQGIKPAVAQLAGPVLAGVFRDGHPLPDRVIDKQLNAVTAAELPHKVGIPAGCLPPDAVVHMGGQHPDGQLTPAAGQKQQKGHRVCPSGAGRNDPVAGLEQPVLPAEGQQFLFSLFDNRINRSRHGCNPDS